MSLLGIVALVFIAVVLITLSLYMWYVAVTTSPRYELKRRLRRLAMDFSDRRFPEELRLEILGEMGPFEKELFKLAPVKMLDRLIEKSGVRVDVKMMLLFIVVSAALTFTIGVLLGRGLWVAFVLAPIGGALPILYLHTKKKARVARFTEQFPDALDMVARSLRAGHSFSAAMQLVGTEMTDPVASLFRTAYEEQSLGVSTREAIAHMAERIDSMDLKFFIMAVNIHREIGGNLGEVLDRLAKTIRERLTIRRQVRVYTAQARLSGYVLAAAPLLIAAIFYFSQPGYIELLWKEQVGRYGLFAALAGQVLGYIVIRRIVNIRI